MKTDIGIDTGDVLYVKKTDILPEETCGDLMQRLSCLGATAICESLDDIILGNIVGSNIMNILFILGICSIVNPLVVTKLELEQLIMLVLSTAIFYFFTIQKKKVTRRDGIFLLISYSQP
jgi:Ca2+/Na+ antiporter